MKLHIVMVVLNNLGMTIKAIESIKTKHKYKLHIIDQESDDDFKSYADSIKAQYTKLIPRKSLAEAWNFGIKEALEDKQCKYIFVPNNDVIFHQDTIDTLIKGIDLFKYSMVTGENVQPKMTLEQMLNGKHGDWSEDSKPVTSWVEQGPDFSCFMITPQTIKDIGLFDENFYPAYCEDQDFHIRILRAGKIAKRLTTAPYYHYASQTLANNPGLIAHISEGHHRNKQYYREKWGADHADCLEGKGFQTPYNEPDKPVTYWRGVEKYA